MNLLYPRYQSSEQQGANRIDPIISSEAVINTSPFHQECHTARSKYRGVARPGASWNAVLGYLSPTARVERGQTDGAVGLK